VRQENGLANIHLMIPHCETVAHSENILETLETYGLQKGEEGLSIYLCCDFPSNVADAPDFTRLFDGLSLDMRKFSGWIHSGERILQETALRSLTPETLMKKGLEAMRDACRAQGGSLMVRDRMFINDPDLIHLLVDVGVNAISIDPESALKIMEWIVAAERKS
jgi:pyruvate,water dikinase